MNQISTPLASSTERRQLLMTASSQAALGLRSDDIFRPGLTQSSDVQTGQAPAIPPSLAEQVFDALAAAKIWTSKLAMHMDLAARDRFFRQLDLLHDCDEWFGGHQPVQIESYKNFVRFMLAIGSMSKPSLALAPNGHLLAVWDRDGDRLTVEFGIDNTVEWVVSRKENERVERAAGSTTTKRLLANIAPYILPIG